MRLEADLGLREERVRAAFEEAPEAAWRDAADADNAIPALDPDNTFGDPPLDDDAAGAPSGGLHSLDESVAAIDLAAIVDRELQDAGSARAVFRLGEWDELAQRMMVVLVGPRAWGPRLREAGYTVCEASTCEHAAYGEVHEIEWPEGLLGPWDPW